jgi:hypothetical protein
MAEEIIKTCDECGAAVYPDHLEKGTAGMVDERLLCPICYREAQRVSTKAEVDDTIALVDDAPAILDEDKPEAKPKIKAFGDDSVFGQFMDHNETRFQRPLVNTGRSAIRCRTFHTKLTEAAISYMDAMINDWIDKNPQIEIKFASSTIGMFEGKQRQVFTFLRDYKAVNGVMVPHLLETVVEGIPGSEKIVIDRVVVNPDLDDARFTKPT